MDPTRLKAALAVLAIAGLTAAGIAIPGGESSETAEAPTGSAEITRTLEAIESGTPLPYEEDGQTFQNREGLLPEKPLGYYREYTVATPGSADRGARRLVIGDGGETYYTDDHYASFVRIEPEEFR